MISIFFSRCGIINSEPHRFTSTGTFVSHFIVMTICESITIHQIKSPKNTDSRKKGEYTLMMNELILQQYSLDCEECLFC